MAKKQLNKNLVVGLTLVGFAMMIVAAVLMLQRLQQRDPKYLVEIAEQRAAEERWRDAATFYKQAWNRTQDAKYLVPQGNMLLADGEVQLALASYQAAVREQSDLTDGYVRQLEVLVELARLYGRLDNWRVVHETVDKFLGSDAIRTPEQTAFANNANGLALINLARREEGSAEQGEVALRSAAEGGPDEVSYSLDLANHLIRTGRDEEGEAIYQGLLERFTASGAAASKVRLAYANRKAALRQWEEAESYFDLSLSMAEGDAKALREAKLGFAMLLWQRWARAFRDDPTDASAQEYYDKAETVLRECVALSPDEFEPYLRLALLYKSAQRYGDVVSVCEERLTRGLSRKGIKAVRHRIDTFTLMIYASESCVGQALLAHGEGDRDERGRWLTKAEQYIADANGEIPSHPRALSQSGRVKLARGKDRAGLDDLRAADEAYDAYDTIDWENKIILAQLHLKLSEAGAAKRVLETVVPRAAKQRGRDSTFWTLYAQTLLANNELDRATIMADHVLTFDPDNASARRVQAAVLERRNRLVDARQALPGDTVTRALLLARQAVLEGDNQRGVSVLQEALQEKPGDPRLVAAVVRALLRLDRSAEAGEIVSDALAGRPDDPQFKRLAILTRGDLSPDEQDQALLEIIEAQDDAYQRVLELIGFYLRKDNQAKGLELINEALGHLANKDTPLAQDATLAHCRALLNTKMTVAAALGDEKAMSAARDEARRYAVDGAGGKSLVGLYYIHHEEFESAAKAFQEVLEVQPTDVFSMVRLGQCQHVLGRSDEAAASFDRAVRINPNAGSAHWGLAILARQRGDLETYEQKLDLCTRLIPNDLRVRKALIERSEKDEPKVAIARRVELYDKDPGGVENVARLAFLCESIGDLDQADFYQDKLVALRGDDKKTIVSVSEYYRRTDRPERSLELVTRFANARNTSAEKADAQILLAAHYLGLGDSKRVEEALLAGADIAETLEVCRSLSDFYLLSAGKPKRALPWFDKAIERARADGSAQLPDLLISRVDCMLRREVDDLSAAGASVREFRAAFPNDPRGLWINSEVAARSGRIEEAVDLLTDYLAVRPGDPDALYQRALHRRTQGRLAAAVEDLEAVKRVAPLAGNLRPRFLLAVLHRHAGRPEAWIRELESVVADAPESIAALQTLVSAYLEDKRLDDADRIVTAQINRSDREPDARWHFLRGQVALERSNESTALAGFQQGCELNGFDESCVTSVLQVHLRFGSPDEGVKYYEQHIRETPASPLLLSSYARSLAMVERKADAVQAFRQAMILASSGGFDAVRRIAADVLTAWELDDALVLFSGGGSNAATARADERILARLLGSAKRFDEASAKLEHLIETCRMDSERAALYQELGETYQVGEKFDMARSAYEEALKYNPNNWVTLNNLAYLLSDQMADNKTALPYARRAVALNDNKHTLDTLGWIYVGLQRFPRAIAELSRAVRLDPGVVLAYYHLGEAYRLNGQGREAGEILRSGRDLARSAEDFESVTRFDEALEQLVQSADQP